MPEENPDELNRLPTAADGLSRKQQIWQAQQGKARTRIGPASPAPETPPPNSPDPSAALSDAWRELFEQPPSTPPIPERPVAAPPPKAPRRTVVGRAAPAEPAPTPPQEAAPAAPRRTVIGRRNPPAEVPVDPPQEALAPPPAESPSAGKATETQPTSPEAPVEPAPASAETILESPPSAGPQTTPQDQEAPPAEPERAAAKDTKEAREPPNPAAPEPPPETSAGEPSPLVKLWVLYWARWGGRALATSLAIHAVMLSSAAWIVVQQVSHQQVDFLSGGGTTQGAQASQALQHRVQQKKNPWLNKPVPTRKLGVANTLSDVVLPDDAPDLMELPQAKSLLDGGRLSGGMGLAGAGGGFGRGMGLGGRDGVTFQPFSLFGMQIKARRLAVVLDVSGSMASHLPRVLQEVDKVAKGSVAVLYYGCGLDAPPPRGLEGDGVYPTSREEFEKFWRLYGGSYDAVRKFRIDRADPIPNEEVFRVLSRRPQTYFIHNVGSSYAWLAMLSEQVRSADALYWFADFQDPVNFRQIGIVRDNLQARKQRLYIHAYSRGGSFDLIQSQLVEKTGGDWRLEQN